MSRHRASSPPIWHSTPRARALDQAGLKGAEIDLIVLATATPDHTFPATATKVQTRLGMTGGCAFDVQAVCTGFIYALAIADNFIRCGQARRALVIGAETFSRILDWEDRGTCVLFGDGAGAVVLSAHRDEGGGAQERGLLSTHLHSDGAHYDILYVDGGPSTTGTAGFLRMQGKEVFRHAVHRLAEVVDEALAANGLTAKDIDWLVPHQANRRIIDSMGEEARPAAGEGGDHHRPPRQHLGRLGAAGARRGRGRRPHQARPARADGGYGRRPDLGCGAGALVRRWRGLTILNLSTG